MDAIQLFPVEERDYDSGREFRLSLSKNLDPASVDGSLTVVVGITKRDPTDLLGALLQFGFRVVRRLGAVTHLHYTGEGEDFETYLTCEEEGGIVVFYSNFRKTEEIPKIVDFLQSDIKSYRLFLRPIVIQAMMGHLADAYADLSVVEFTARRAVGSRQAAKIRPSEPRVIVYWGNDGKETLQELRMLYGVLPQRAVVDIPNVAKLSLDGKGIFTLMSGAPGVLFGVIEEALEEGTPTLRAFDKSAFQVVAIRTQEREFQIPSSTPAEILLSRKLEYSEMDELRSELEEADFGIVNFIAEEGSLFLSADLVAHSGERFRLKATESRIRMLPTGPPELSTFMALFQFVVNTVDPRAELSPDIVTERA
jgi:hypothetical protein